LATVVSKPRERLSADALIKAYQEDADRKRTLIRRAETTRNRLLVITEGLRRLSADETFLTLLEEEDLATLPQNLADRLDFTSRPAT
jgi:ParB family chromosome partitioning protein